MIKRIQLKADQDGVNLAPLLDIVFIMLIFFIVTATFIKEEGIPMGSQPDDSVTKTEQKKNIQLAVTEDCWVVMNHQRTAPDAVAPRVQAMRADRPNGPAIISIEGEPVADCVVGVMDQVRQAGVTSISLRNATPVE